MKPYDPIPIAHLTLLISITEKDEHVENNTVTGEKQENKINVAAKNHREQILDQQPEN